MTTITPAEVEARLELAALTLRRLPDPPGSGPRGHGSSWPDYVRDARHAYGYGEARMKVTPSAADIARMEECLGWLELVGGETPRKAAENRRIVWMRADGWRWAQVCRHVGVARSTAHRRWMAALVTIARRLAAMDKGKAPRAPRVARKAPDRGVPSADGDGSGTLP